MTPNASWDRSHGPGGSGPVWGWGGDLVQGGGGDIHSLPPQEGKVIDRPPLPPWTGPPPCPQEGKVIDPPPPNTGTAVYARAGGTHPTGMHSCSRYFLQRLQNRIGMMMN